MANQELYQNYRKNWVNIRCNNLQVDGTYSGNTPAIPDPLVVNDLTVSNSISFASRVATIGTVTQVGLPTDDVVLNTQIGLITTVAGVTILPGESNIFGLQNNLITGSTLCRVWLHSYSGAITPPAGPGLISVNAITAPGNCLIQITNIGTTVASPGGDLNGTFEIAFELIQSA